MKPLLNILIFLKAFIFKCLRNQTEKKRKTSPRGLYEMGCSCNTILFTIRSKDVSPKKSLKNILI